MIAIGTTGQKAKEAGFKVEALLSGPIGGDAQMAAGVEEKKVDLVIFFRDPLAKHPQELDIFILMRLCDVHNIPLVTNPATAELLSKGL